MAVDVIDRLEAIEVDNAERQACPLKLCMLKSLIKMRE